MNRLYALLSGLALLLFTALPLAAQPVSWSFIGPFGNAFEKQRAELTRDSGGTLYAAASIYAARSTDDGATWTRIPGSFFSLRAAGADTLYAFRSDGFSRSTDAGDTWMRVLPGEPSWLPFTGGTLLASVNEEATSVMYVVSPEGSTSRLGMLPARNLQLLGYAADGAIVGRAGDTLYRSATGSQWTAVGSVQGLGTTRHFGRTGSGALVLVGDSAAVYRSTDDGTSWSTSGALPVARGQVIDATIDMGGDLYLSSLRDGVHRSTDDGATWTKTTPLTFITIVALDAGPGALIASHAYGLMRSTDRGETWTDASIGFPGGGISSVLAIGDTALHVVSNNDRRVRSSTDPARWPISPIPESGSQIRTPDNRIIVQNTSSSWRLYYSTNAGWSWDSTLPNPYFSARPMIAIDRDGSIILASERTIRSSDLGETWQTLDTVHRVYGDIELDSTGRLLSFFQRSLATFNRTAGQWEELPTSPSLPNGATELLTMPDGTIIIGTYNDGIVRSTDNGVTWHNLDAPDSLESIVVNRRGDLVALSFTYGAANLHLSRDRGARWYPISQGIPFPVTAVDILPNGRVAAGTEIGVYLSDDITLGVDDDVASAKLTALVTPNPMTTTADIAITLERATDATITLVASDGTALRTLHRGPLSAGTSRVAIDLDGIAAGAYFVRIVAGDHGAVVSVVLSGR